MFPCADASPSSCSDFMCNVVLIPVALWLPHQYVGIEYCHNVHHICHRDLKPENFLFKTMYSDDDIKIIDFGLSCINNKVGSNTYVIPCWLRLNTTML